MHALCIGVDDYPFAGLSGCANDAFDWAEELDSRGFDVVTLIDRAATRTRIGEEIRARLDGTEGDALFVITYSGHGSWLPEDADEPSSPRRGIDIGPRLLDAPNLVRPLLGGSGPRLVLISDSCHSGSGVDGEPAPARWGRSRERSPRSAGSPRGCGGADRGGDDGASLFRGFSCAGGDLLLAGCTSTQRAWGLVAGGRPGGAFTHHALSTLRDLPREASYDEWFGRIRARLPTTRAPQEPQLFGAPDARRSRILT